ncbi:MAG: glutamate--tRNA ligase family protein, partial [Bacilli bacterium]
MDKEIVRTRFAPSPTGFMHVGNLRSALYTYYFARQHNGAFILRIEDTDVERYVEGAVETILKTLELAGIDYDEGPGKEGDVGPYYQSQRKPLYKKYAEELIAKGSAYYCFCSKERLESLKDEHGNVRYDRHCWHLSKEEIERKLANNEPYVIRQKMPDEGIVQFNDLIYGLIEVD